MPSGLKNFTYIKISNFLISISKGLSSLSAIFKLKSLDIRQNLHLGELSDSANYLKEVSEDPLKITDLPDEIAASVDADELRNSVYLYFLTKQVIAIYESKINLLPLQVFNEMRNALDHHFRSVLTLKTDEETQKNKLSEIKKMEGHIHRALLDVIKLTCAAIVHNIENSTGKIGIEAMAYVDNGDFFKTLKDKTHLAEIALCEAKRNEYLYGENTSNNKTVCDLYLTALFAHLNLDDYYKKYQGKMYWGKAKYLSIKSSSFILTVLGTLTAGYLVKVLWESSENTPIIQWCITHIHRLFGGV